MYANNSFTLSYICTFTLSVRSSICTDGAASTHSWQILQAPVCIAVSVPVYLHLSHFILCFYRIPHTYEDTITASHSQPKVWSVDHNNDIAFTNSMKHTTIYNTICRHSNIYTTTGEGKVDMYVTLYYDKHDITYYDQTR